VQADTTAYVNSFLLPPYEGGWDGGQPVLGGGDLAAAFTDNENVRAVLENMFSPSWGEVWSGEEGSEFVSPYSTFDSANYLSETYANIAAQVADADAFRFDGSDLMPGQVGSGAFWTEMTQWVTEQIDLDTALQNIENAWPSS
jgi:alpha-glucoside transport system substrate-binding protein